MKVNTPFGEATVTTARYITGNSTAVFLTQQGSRLATISVNVEGVSEHLPEGTFVAKTYSENALLVHSLQQSGLFEDTGDKVLVGRTECPIWRLV